MQLRLRKKRNNHGHARGDGKRNQSGRIVHDTDRDYFAFYLNDARSRRGEIARRYFGLALGYCRNESRIVYRCDTLVGRTPRNLVRSHVRQRDHYRNR